MMRRMRGRTRMTPLKRAVLVHGYQGTPLHGWRPWLREELVLRGWQVSIPAMPNPDAPKCDEWVKTISREVGAPSPICALVGHSLGCIAILRYLERLPASAKVGSVILVAGFGHDLGNPALSSFSNPPLNWAAIRSHAPRVILLHSDNDPFIPLSEGYFMQKELGAELIVQKGMGHFSSSEGTKRLPIVLERLLEK